MGKPNPYEDIPPILLKVLIHLAVGCAMTTIRAALDWGTERLVQAGQRSARLDAQVLLSHILGVERSMLYAYPERAISTEQERGFHALIERRVQHEPVAYLIGHKEFYGLDFVVDRRVLIPRPETELLVEAALERIHHRLEGGQVPLVADIGTGSGAIPVTLAVEEARLPYLYACDISSEALEVARLNCQRYHVERRVRLLQGNLLAPLPEPVDILTANLPYIGSEEKELLEPDVLAYEPHLALFSGPTGLGLLRRFCQEVRDSGKVRPHAAILLEIGYQQREPLTPLLREFFPRATVSWKKDYAGWERLLQIML
jgi:release factor glutamine methyltransferase